MASDKKAKTRAKKPNRIPAALKPLETSIMQLQFDTANEREHGSANLASIKSSLRKFGQDQVIVAERGSNIVIAGEGRVKAMRELGWDTAAVLFLEPGENRAAIRVLDNRTAELSRWDKKALSDQIRKLQEGGHLPDVTEIGFTPEQIEKLHGAFASNQPEQLPTGHGGGQADIRMVQLVMSTAAKNRFDAVAMQLRLKYGGKGIETGVMAALRAECAKGSGS